MKIPNKCHECVGNKICKLPIRGIPKCLEFLKALESKLQFISSTNKQSEEIKCNKCGKVLPPMELGEGEPCESGYLCRKCFGLDS